MTKPVRDPSDKPKDLTLDKASTVGQDCTEEGVAPLAAGSSGAVPAPSASSANISKPGSPAAPPSPLTADQKRGGQDVTSQGVQTTSTLSGPKHEEKEEKKEAVQEWVDWDVIIFLFWKHENDTLEVNSIELYDLFPIFIFY